MTTIRHLDQLYAIGAEGLFDALSTLRQWHKHRVTHVFDVAVATQRFSIGIGETWYWIDEDGDLRPLYCRRERGVRLTSELGAVLPPFVVGECAIKIWHDGKVWVYRITGG